MTETLATILAQTGPMGPMGGGLHGPMHGWGAMGAGTGWWGFLTLLLVVLAVGSLAFVFVLVARRGTFDGGDDALAELRRAYARGDLSDEEYERRRARLS